MIKDLLLVGAGTMSSNYAKVLNALNIPFDVIGRGEKSALKFEKFFDKKVIIGGISNYLKVQKSIIPKRAIIAVSVDELAKTTEKLIENGVTNILVEKPAAMDFNQIEKVALKAKEKKSNVFVAYNRRYYSSVVEAKKIIKNDGGVKSFNFEFTEWSHKIRKLQKPIPIKNNWFFANSTHVIDLAFYLGGIPETISCFVTGGLDWHPSASVFSGAGRTKDGALFSYQANWEAPGRWGIEILTRNNRLIFRPLEKLQIQKIGSNDIKTIELNDILDRKFKAGLYLQTKNFIEDKTDKSCSIDEHFSMVTFYKKFLGA